MRLTGLILVSFIFTILFSSALLMTVPYALADKLIWMGLSVPLTWTISMMYCYWDEKAWRPVATLSSLSIVSAVVVLLSPIPV